MAVFTSSGTWTIPAGITKCKITVTGGGGGTYTNYPTSGGAGGTAIKYLTLSGGSMTITVGAGGAIDTSSPGGSSSVVYGATTVTGGGGQNSVGGIINYGGSGGGGDLNIYGGAGLRTNNTAEGGVSFWGGDYSYGSGGSVLYAFGAFSFNSGNAGVVVIEY